ncbi:hypothetical protein U1Q18_044137 [Sarracenia purpurea var. burkii]
MAVTSIGGQRYFKVFLDDYTLKTGLSMRKSKKDEPLANLKHFMIEQERFTGCKLKVRRSDRGGFFKAVVSGRSSIAVGGQCAMSVFGQYGKPGRRVVIVSRRLISEGKPLVRRCGSVPVRKAVVLLVVGDGLLGAVRWLWFSFWETRTTLSSRFLAFEELSLLLLYWVFPSSIHCLLCLFASSLVCLRGLQVDISSVPVCGHHFTSFCFLLLAPGSPIERLRLGRDLFERDWGQSPNRIPAESNIHRKIFEKERRPEKRDYLQVQTNQRKSL